jgi:hypothetical protein
LLDGPCCDQLQPQVARELCLHFEAGTSWYMYTYPLFIQSSASNIMIYVYLIVVLERSINATVELLNGISAPTGDPKPGVRKLACVSRSNQLFYRPSTRKLVCTAQFENLRVSFGLRSKQSSSPRPLR